MSDLSWTNVRNFFDPELMGRPLPNVVIEGTSVEGSGNDQVHALSTASEVFASGRSAHFLLKVRPFTASGPAPRAGPDWAPPSTTVRKAIL